MGILSLLLSHLDRADKGLNTFVNIHVACETFCHRSNLLCLTDSITLPNGLPLNCLFYADDLILISRSAAGLQKQLNILHSYSEKWLLKINLKKTKTLIFQKQNRKSTRDKFSFFLNGIPIDKASQYNYLGIIFNTNGSFANSKKALYSNHCETSIKHFVINLQ